MIMTSLSLAMGCGGLCVVEASPEKALEEEYAGRLMTLISDSFEPHKSLKLNSPCHYCHSTPRRIL
jgi:hypothetical protein